MKYFQNRVSNGLSRFRVLDTLFCCLKYYIAELWQWILVPSHIPGVFIVVCQMQTFETQVVVEEVIKSGKMRGEDTYEVDQEAGRILQASQRTLFKRGRGYAV